ncbi:uncharacterized protein LOC132741045 [Ruditapes philippinarum]|uniref:uncharacterized protein LOC132741045 n=1 Tax=Ruditapes philippinarum TaxID=129788 RepID=UPI00295B4469|nr:uncharacterized protein LOC132741045 [Ruditapes philippinarum]
MSNALKNISGQYVDLALLLEAQPSASASMYGCRVLNIEKAGTRGKPGTSTDTRSFSFNDVQSEAERLLNASFADNTSLIAAAYCLAFFAFLRVSELAVSNKDSAANVISISDLLVDSSEGYIIVTIRYSKTDQYGRGSVLKIKRSNSAICVVSNMLEFLKRRPQVDGPLFCHLNGKPLTRYQFTSVLKKCLNNLRLDYGKFTSHSFRIGAATAAAMLGYDVETIKRAGRWRSEAYRVYLKKEDVHTLPCLAS